MEILIWGDNMKRQISVSILLAMLVITLALLYIKFSNETKVENEVKKDEPISVNQEYVVYPYYIKAEHGRLVVYENNSGEIFMETGIGIYALPYDIQLNLEPGIFFSSEQELYDFLESYSS